MAVKTNDRILRFYWSLSYDLKKELPDAKTFSVTNLHYESWFYELYPDALNLPQIVGDSGNNNLPQVEVDSDSVIFKIPWGTQ